MKNEKKRPEKKQTEVQPGTGSPGSLNPNLQAPTKRPVSVADYIAGIRAGNHLMLSRAITLVESTRADHQRLGNEIVEGCLPYRSDAIRIGITGAPGVGKSTFIEALGNELLQRDRRPAILAVDPSSQISHGSILGDKTRMEKLSAHPRAFIRPSPTGGALGGVASKTREAIFLCEAAGFDTILVETVGVGQSEIAVHSMVDFFLLLLLPGAGDELQGIKRGIVEMADLIAVNKAEGARNMAAKQAQAAYRNALHLFPPKASGWTPKVVTCSALQSEGTAEIWEIIAEFHQSMRENGYLQHNRQLQAKQWMYQYLDHQLRQRLLEQPRVKTQLALVEAEVVAGKCTSMSGAMAILELVLPKT